MWCERKEHRSYTPRNRRTSLPLSAREPQASRMTYSNPSVYMGAEGADEDTIMLTTECRVRNTIDALLGKMA